MTIGGTQVRSAGSRLPIIEVNDIGNEVQRRQCLEESAAKEEEAKILIVPVQAEIDLLMPAKHFCIFHEIDGNRCIWEGGLKKRNREVVPGHRDCSYDTGVFE